jgi:hypothetical protein
VLVEEKLFQLDGLLMHRDITREDWRTKSNAFFCPKKAATGKRENRKSVETLRHHLNFRRR